MNAPTTIQTERLLLRKPQAADAASIFERYAADSDVCRYLAWPRHRSIDDTLAFLAFSDAQWRQWPAGPYLICSLSNGELLGSTGLQFKQPECASTGYVLARDSWGKGLATEALLAMRKTAQDLSVARLYATVHPQHHPSRRVLEKSGFELEGTLRQSLEFPNLEAGVKQDVVCYSWTTNDNTVSP